MRQVLEVVAVRRRIQDGGPVGRVGAERQARLRGDARGRLWRAV